jgi:hypothetical protein
MLQDSAGGEAGRVAWAQPEQGGLQYGEASTATFRGDICVSPGHW